MIASTGSRVLVVADKIVMRKKIKHIAQNHFLLNLARYGGQRYGSVIDLQVTLQPFLKMGVTLACLK